MANIIEIECPVCHTALWIDTETQSVIQHKRTKKKNFASFDELLNREKEKKEKTEERFSAAKQLEEEKKKKAETLFQKSLKEKK